MKFKSRKNWIIVIIIIDGGLNPQLLECWASTVQASFIFSTKRFFWGLWLIFTVNLAASGCTCGVSIEDFPERFERGGKTHSKFGLGFLWKKRRELIYLCFLTADTVGPATSCCRAFSITMDRVLQSWAKATSSLLLSQPWEKQGNQGLITSLLEKVRSKHSVFHFWTLDFHYAKLFDYKYKWHWGYLLVCALLSLYIIMSWLLQQNLAGIMWI